MKFRNFTPHDVVLVDDKEQEVIYPSEGIVRVGEIVSEVYYIEGIPVVNKAYGIPEGLPEPANGVMYIVSGLVAQVAVNRNDLLIPDTGPSSAIRDSQGRIKAVSRFMILEK